MARLRTLLLLLCAAVLTPGVGYAQSYMGWNIDIVENDRIGASYNAHTVARHVGKTINELAYRAQTEGLPCASTFWSSYEANLLINNALNRAEQVAANAGMPGPWDQILSAPLYGKVIVRQFDFNNPVWFHGIYIAQFGSQFYGANGVRVVLKRVPPTVTPLEVIVETAYPEIDPAAYSYCIR